MWCVDDAACSADDAIISDELNHASIIDGIRLAKAQRYRYKHLDLADLDVCAHWIDCLAGALGEVVDHA